MTTLTDPADLTYVLVNQVSVLTDRVAKLEGERKVMVAYLEIGVEAELRDLRASLRALEKRADQDDAIRDKLREIAAEPAK